MRRVILFSKALLPYSETFIKNQALTMHRWRPTLVGERFLKNGLPLDGLDARLIYPHGGAGFHRFRYKYYLFLQKPYQPGLHELKKLDASLMHAHFGTSAVDIWPVARALNLPLMVTLHGYDINTYREWWEAGKGGWRRRRYPEQLLLLAQEDKVHFIAVSEAIRNRAIECGISQEKITVHYIGVDAEKFQPDGLSLAQRPKRILFVGRLVEKKGGAYLIRAFSKVRDNIPDAELEIVGDGPLRGELERLAESLGVPVHFAGVMSEAQIRARMSQMRALCLPSITAVNGEAEGLPIVLLEAQACGLPVISSARGGVTEGLLDGETGFRCNEKDVECLAASIERLLRDESLWKRFSANAVSFVREKFDLRSCTKRLEAIYDQHAGSFPSDNARVPVQR